MGFLRWFHFIHKKMMHQASLYTSYNTLQWRDASRVLAQTVPALHWGEYETILDIGCGPGDVTAHLLLPAVPATATVTGCDVSCAMIEHAKTVHANPRLSFHVLDIASEEAALETHTRFSKIFSFYCLHWVQDQRRTASNMLSLLSPGGEAVVAFLATNPVFALYREMAALRRWRCYMTDVDQFVSPYHGTSEPAHEYKRAVQTAGFTVLACDCKATSFTYPSVRSLLKSIEAVNPFLERIPAHLQAEFMEDARTIIERDVQTRSKLSKQMTLHYQLIVAHLRKPQ